MSVPKPHPSSVEAVSTQIERVEAELVLARGDLAAAKFRLGHALASGRDTKSADAEVEDAQHRVARLRSHLTGLRFWRCREQYQEVSAEISKVESELESLNGELPELRAAVEDGRKASFGENIPNVAGNAFALKMRERRAEANDRYDRYAAANLRRLDLEKRLAVLVDRRDDLAGEFRDLSHDHLEIDDNRIAN